MRIVRLILDQRKITRVFAPPLYPSFNSPFGIMYTIRKGALISNFGTLTASNAYPFVCFSVDYNSITRLPSNSHQLPLAFQHFPRTFNDKYFHLFWKTITYESLFHSFRSVNTFSLIHDLSLATLAD